MNRLSLFIASTLALIVAALFANAGEHLAVKKPEELTAYIELNPDQSDYEVGQNIRLVCGIRNGGSGDTIVHSRLAIDRLEIRIPKLEHELFEFFQQGVGTGKEGTPGLLLKEYFLTISPKEKLVKMDIELLLNVMGDLDIMFIFENQYDQYLAEDKDGFPKLKERIRMQNAWTGKVRVHKRIAISKSEDLQEVASTFLQQLSEKEPMSIKVLSEGIKRGPSLMAKTLLNGLGKIEATNRGLLLKGLSENIDKGDAFLLVAEVITHLENNDFSRDEIQRYIRPIISKATEGISVDSYLYTYTLKADVAERIRDLLDKRGSGLVQ